LTYSLRSIVESNICTDNLQVARRRRVIIIPDLQIVCKRERIFMSTETTTEPKAILQRGDIEKKYTWDLSDIFADDDAWEKAYAEAKTLIEKAKDYTGKLKESAQTLFDCLQLRDRIGIEVHNLSHYAFLKKDLDNRVSAYQAMYERSAMLGSAASAALSFLEPELLEISDDNLRTLAGQFPQTDLYDFYIERLIRSRKHIRSTEIEELLAQSTVVARCPDSAFSMLDNADMQYGSIKDEHGQEVKLTKQRYIQFMESSDPRVRQDAHFEFMKAYKDKINTLSAMLSGSVNADVFYSRARRYDNCLQSALDGNNIPTSVYRSLIETTESNLEPLHKWIAVRKKILKLDEIAPYDLICPLFPDQDYRVPYEEAVTAVIEACQPLGETYGKHLKHAFANRWIDVYETEGKGGGAYNSPNYDIHPYVLMNYNDTVNNVFTLAHELGHAMHSTLSSEKQPFSKAHYSIFVAEVASTLNEGLLLQYLLKKATDKGQKLYLLNRHIDNTFGTFFNQILYAHFELDIHEMVEKGKALSPDILSDMWHKLSETYFGPACTVDKFTRFKWSRIPHFYYTFYVYQYATSYAASQAILGKFLAGEEGIIEKYLALISSGGNDYPINQLKKCGVDMTTPDPVMATLKLFADQVDEVEKLTQ